MVRSLFQIATVLLFTLPGFAQAEILFEGYSKITSGDTHIGYSVSRYEYDPTKKRFFGTYFLKTGAMGADISESVKAIADQDLNPISYEYTSKVGKKLKTIDAKFTLEKSSGKIKMTAHVTDDGKKTTIRKDLPKGAFLSNFLIYLMLRGEKGLQTDARYEYQAIAEEDADLSKGDAYIEKREVHRGHDAFRILNRFKGVRFISFVSDRGEVLSTSSPTNGIGTQLVANPAEAIGKFGASAEILKALFGQIPEGKKNLLAQAAEREQRLKENPPSKQQDIPGGQGIMIKPGSSKESDQ